MSSLSSPMRSSARLVASSAVSFSLAWFGSTSGFPQHPAVAACSSDSVWRGIPRGCPVRRAGRPGKNSSANFVSVRNGPARDSSCGSP
eukprot:3482737-Heterocapsa_arctica.AAC.1